MTDPDSRPPLERAALSSRARRLGQAGRTRLILMGLIAAVVLCVDQLTKMIVRASIERGDPISLLPGLSLSNTTNEGLAFGLFPGRPGLVALLTVVVVVAIGVPVLRAARQSLMVALGGGLLLGGSVGNMIDRAFRGGVTDFIDPVRWPAFNVADIGVVCGSALIVVALAFGDERTSDS